MKMRPIVMFASLFVIYLGGPGNSAAQESPQKGQSAGKLEMSQQIRAGNAESFDVKATEALRHAHKKPLMTPMQSTDVFLGLDRNHDMALTRSELPRAMSVLRVQFDKYDLDHDHRLNYSEFANYTDVVPAELAESTH
ncbi:EF-hand domain-containing protein [Rhodanobacter sp. Col0626]|uniref:EF-hand domain-containing protein n=1 Tax=Rhodanobacter sp. Col0626 TaxID=3415679 RepID=UPI003CF0C5A9